MRDEQGENLCHGDIDDFGSIDPTSHGNYVDEDEQGENEQMNECEHKLKKGMEITFKLVDGSEHQGKIIRRTGKATGKYRNFWEIENFANGEKEEYDTEEEWATWKQERRKYRKTQAKFKNKKTQGYQKGHKL